MINFFCNIPAVVQMLIALLLPFLLCLCVGPKMIAVLKALKAGQPIREARKGVLAPEHSAKVGTPTMGGVMLIGSVLLTALLFFDLTSPFIQCVLLVTALTALLGFTDDYAKITKHSTDGVSGWFKIAIQCVASLACGCYLYYLDPGIAWILVPFYGVVDLGWLFIPFALLVIIGSSNAVNLTDGLDGLASGCMILASLTFMVMFTFAGVKPLNPYLMAIVSACLGFLWFNCHPAKVFMGDTGSLALGGALGTIAICSHTALILVIIGGVFVAEATSVMIQVGWFKLSRKLYGEGRRFFRMAPIHHHFEKGGVPETQVVVRFWIVTFFLGILGIVMAVTALFGVLKQEMQHMAPVSEVEGPPSCSNPDGSARCVGVPPTPEMIEAAQNGAAQ